MQYHKLVRDRIPELIRKNGGNPKLHCADCITFGYALKNKLREEVEEFCQSEKPEEIADILEVIEEICRYHGFSQKSVERIKKKKAKEKGRFRKRIILEEA